jgi:hypothetical protein
MRLVEIDSSCGITWNDAYGDMLFFNEGFKDGGAQGKVIVCSSGLEFLWFIGS